MQLPAAAGNDADEEVFFLLVERSAQQGRHHDGEVVVDVEQKLNKQRWGHLPTKQAKKAMVEAGTPEAHIPGDRALDGYRHRYLQGGLSYDGKFVETFKEFCRNPPAPVTVLQTDELPIISSDVVRVVFYEAENVRLAMKYLEDKDRCVLIMDATFKTNTQELVLAGLGISVLHVDRGVVRNRFWPVVCAVSDAEDEGCYTQLCRSFQKLAEDAGLDWANMVTNIVMDGAGGAIAATRSCFPMAVEHRDLEHVKRDFKRNAAKRKCDTELSNHILDILQFSAKIAHPLHFHIIWEDTLRRLHDPEDWNQDLD